MSADSIESIWHKAFNAWTKASRHGTKEQADQAAIEVLRALPSAELERDAGRYRHIREFTGAPSVWGRIIEVDCDGDEMDRVIDAAIDAARAVEAQRQEVGR